MPPAKSSPRMRKFTWRRTAYSGMDAIFTMAPKARAVPTAVAGGTRKSKISKGVVMVPAPTPVREIASAMTKPITNSILVGHGDVSGLSDVDAAFEFAAGPTPGARVARIGWQRGAGVAADARIADIVERQQRNAMLARKCPDVFVGPTRER